MKSTINGRDKSDYYSHTDKDLIKDSESIWDLIEKIEQVSCKVIINMSTEPSNNNNTVINIVVCDEDEFSTKDICSETKTYIEGCDIASVINGKLTQVLGVISKYRQPKTTPEEISNYEKRADEMKNADPDLQKLTQMRAEYFALGKAYQQKLAKAGFEFAIKNENEASDMYSDALKGREMYFKLLAGMKEDFEKRKATFEEDEKKFNESCQYVQAIVETCDKLQGTSQHEHLRRLAIGDLCHRLGVEF